MRPITQMSDPVPVHMLAVTPLAEELQEEPAWDGAMEEAGTEEQVENNVPVTEPSWEEVLPMRRSTQATKPQEILTYDHRG